jgi:hypothetical protein
MRTEIEARHIGRGPKTERLYKLEEQAAELVKEIAKEINKLDGRKDSGSDLYDFGVPQALAALADHFHSTLLGHFKVYAERADREG